MLQHHGHSRHMVVLWAAAAAVATFLAGSPFISAVGMGLFAYLLVQLVYQWGKTVPIQNFILAMAGLEWIVGAVLSYQGLGEHPKYYMYVSEKEYMWLAVPGLFGLTVGLQGMARFWKRSVPQDVLHAVVERVRRQSHLPYYLIGLGIAASLLKRHVPESLDFVFWLLSNVKFVGVLYLLFSQDRKKWGVLAVAIILSGLSAMQAAMFFEFLLWTVFFSFYVAIIRGFSMKTKVGLLVIGFIGIIALQGMKMQYRKMIWYGTPDSETVLFARLLGEELGMGGEEFLGNDAVGSTVIRINEGWIVSRIMQHVPQHTPFADGETVFDAVYASLVPRFLDPDKTRAGGSEHFERFTGYELIRTSMGISVLGEGYANFGVTGAWLFLGAYGALLGMGLGLLYSMCRRWPTLILWFPLIFLYPVKAEAELAKVLNHFVKSGLLTVGFFWFATNFLGWKM